MVKITCNKHEVDYLKEILKAGMKVVPTDSCGWNCNREENKCAKCIENYVNEKIEWYNLDTECVKHDANGKWHFYPAERILE